MNSNGNGCWRRAITRSCKLKKKKKCKILSVYSLEWSILNSDITTIYGKKSKIFFISNYVLNQALKLVHEVEVEKWVGWVTSQNWTWQFERPTNIFIHFFEFDKYLCASFIWTNLDDIQPVPTHLAHSLSCLIDADKL